MRTISVIILYGNLASKVLGFTGGDNQGIVGLEVKYEKYLKGDRRKILTTTDARGYGTGWCGRGQKGTGSRKYAEDQPGCIICRSMHSRWLKKWNGKAGRQCIYFLMNPQNGEIYAMVNVPEFDLNDPFILKNEEQ